MGEETDDRLREDPPPARPGGTPVATRPSPPTASDWDDGDVGDDWGDWEPEPHIHPWAPPPVPPHDDGGDEEGVGPRGPPQARRLVALLLALLLAALAGVAGMDLAGSPGRAPTVGGGAPAPAPAPNAAAVLARTTDPGLVDIATTLGFRAAAAAGTGMVIGADGDVLTNNHVIIGATDIRVTDVGNHRTYRATVVGYDQRHDVAVLHLLGASRLRTIRSGDSDTLRRGQGVVVVGNAGGAGGTPHYSGGMVTGLGQSVSAEDDLNGRTEELTGLIETDATVLAGDSGGALVDAAGWVVGMVTAGSARDGTIGGSARGYAVPINQALALATQIVSGRASSTVHVGPTAFLGVETEAPVVGPGASIADVLPDGPAAAAGLVAGDTITAVDGQPVDSPGALTEWLLAQTPGTTVVLQYLLPGGSVASTTVRLGSGPPE